MTSAGLKTRSKAVWFDSHRMQGSVEREARVFGKDTEVLRRQMLGDDTRDRSRSMDHEWWYERQSEMDLSDGQMETFRIMSRELSKGLRLNRTHALALWKLWTVESDSDRREWRKPHAGAWWVKLKPHCSVMKRSHRSIDDDTRIINKWTCLCQTDKWCEDTYDVPCWRTGRVDNESDATMRASGARVESYACAGDWDRNL